MKNDMADPLVAPTRFAFGTVIRHVRGSGGRGNARGRGESSVLDIVLKEFREILA